MDEKFIFAPVDVIKDHRLSLMQLRVLLALFSFRSKNTDVVFPKRLKLAQRCGYSEKIISRTTTQLVNLGWIEKIGNGGRSAPCKYKITFPDLDETVTDSVTVTYPVTVTDSVPKTVTESVRGKELTNELTITTYYAHENSEKVGSKLNALHREVFEWACTDSYWVKCTNSEEDFLRAYCSPKGGMRRQFEQRNNVKKTIGENNAAHRQSAKKLSPAERIRKAAGIGEFAVKPINELD
jgi:hypothetical protein